MEPMSLVTTAVVVISLLGLIRAGEAVRRTQSRLARELGLQFAQVGRWLGSRDGIEVVVHVDGDPQDPFSVRAPAPFGMPRGLRLRPDAHRRDARLLWPAVAPLVERLVARGLQVEIGALVIVRRPAVHRKRSLEQRQREIDHAIDGLVALLKALDEGYRELVRPPGSDGLPVRIAGPRLTYDTWSLEVRAPIARPLPSGTRIGVRRGRGPGLGDLVLDHALSATADDRRALARRVARDEVRGPLLDVVAAHPGSEVLADEVVHVVEDGALDVAGAVRRVRELVAALDDASPGDQPTA